MKKLLIAISMILMLLILMPLMFANATTNKITVAVQPTFAAHQAIGYEILKRLPANAEKAGISNLEVITVPSKSSITGNSFLLNKQIDVNVGSLSSFFILNSKAPNQGRLLASVGHYKYYLLCDKSIKNLNDALGTTIAMSSRNTLEAHTLRWMAQNELGDAEAFEQKIVVMKRPQIYQIMKAKSSDVKCAMTGAPMQNQLKNTLDLQVIAESDVSKGFAGSYNAYWARTEWVNANPILARVYAQTATEVTSDYNSDLNERKAIVKRFVEKDNMEVSVDSVLQAEKENKAMWHSDFRGGQFMIDFLYNTNYLKENRPESLTPFIAFPKDLR